MAYVSSYILSWEYFAHKALSGCSSFGDELALCQVLHLRLLLIDIGHESGYLSLTHSRGTKALIISTDRNAEVVVHVGLMNLNGVSKGASIINFTLAKPSSI